MTKKYKPSKLGDQTLVAFLYSNSGAIRERYYLAKRDRSNVMVSLSRVRNARGDLELGELFEDIYYGGGSSFYLKDAEWVAIKLKPAHTNGIHRFEVLKSEADRKLGLQKANEQCLKFIRSDSKVNLHDSLYCIALKGTRIDEDEWKTQSVSEQNHHKIMRKILKQPCIWQSYPNLYPRAKESIPHFNMSGTVLNPWESLPYLNPPALRDSLPNPMKYVQFFKSQLGFRPTFYEPNNMTWEYMAI